MIKMIKRGKQNGKNSTFGGGFEGYKADNC